MQSVSPTIDFVSRDKLDDTGFIVLTQAGKDLEPVLLAITHWGDKYRPHPKGTRLIFKDRETGVPIQPIHAITEDGKSLKPGELTAEPGPGA